MPGPSGDNKTRSGPSCINMPGPSGHVNPPSSDNTTPRTSRAMANLGNVLLLLLLFSVYTEAPTIKPDDRPSTWCLDVKMMEGGLAVMTFISSDSLLNIKHLYIFRVANGRKEKVLELSDGNVDIPTFLADGFEYRGVADTKVTLVTTNATRAMGGIYHMETSEAVYSPLWKTCSVTVNPKVPELRPPVNSSNGPWQVYSAVVTVVLVILILIVLYKRRDYKQMRKRLDKQRDQSPPTEIKVVGQSEDGGRKNDSTETNDQGIIEQVKWKKPMLVASSQQASGQEQGDMLGDIHVDGEDRKRMEADNLCSDVTSAPAVSSPTPALSMRDGITSPPDTSIDIPPEPSRGAARNRSARDCQDTVHTIVSMGDGITSPQSASIDIPQSPQRGAVRNHSAKDCQPTVHTNTGYGHGTGGSGGHGGGSGGGGYGGGRSGDCGVGVGNGSGGGQEGPEEQQPLLEQRTQPQD